MYDSAKYLIHADITASGVVERSDVVGAVFGQTEGLLGDDLDLRDLQESQKLGRIDVEVGSEGGQSYGEITIASGLDRVETAILAAALESIDRVGPCRADIEVTELEDVRTAKRREIVHRATELLAEFDEASLTSQDIVEEVREAVRVEDVTEFHGFPAGPRVGESDAIIVVEGRADVLTLLRYGVKNAIAVEGTDVPDEVARLTDERTVTAFLDGDRGGDLILKELAQVGDIDYVALAPPGRSVEDLSRGEVMEALRDKVPFETVDEDADAETMAAADEARNSTTPADERPEDAAGEAAPVGDGGTATDGDAATDGESPGSGTAAPSPPGPETGKSDASADTGPAQTGPDPDSEGTDDPGAGTDGSAAESDATADEDGARSVEGESESESDAAESEAPPETLAGHVEAVIGAGSGQVRALDGEFGVIEDRPAEESFDLLESVDPVPATVVLDGELSQRVLDVAAQRGVERVVCAREGEYVKQPTAVRVQTA